MSEPLHLQLLRAIVKSDCLEAMRLLDAGADPTKQVNYDDMPADMRELFDAGFRPADLREACPMVAERIRTMHIVVEGMERYSNVLDILSRE